MTAQPTVPPPAQPQPNIPNYLVFSILTTIFCCLPFGIVALVYSVGVNSALDAGNIPAALEKSAKAKTWCIVSAASAVVVAILYVIFIVVLGFGAAMTTTPGEFVSPGAM